MEGKGREAELTDVCGAEFCDTVFVVDVRVDLQSHLPLPDPRIPVQSSLCTWRFQGLT